MVAPIHLQPTAPIAPRALLPGDPGRALALAQTLLDQPLMCNHNRGLWGYTGRAADGEPLTIQSTGMGGPSAAIVASELIDLGVRRLIRVGTCGAIAAGLALGDLVVATEAIAADGASRALGAGERVSADAGLSAALAADHAGPVVSSDLFYDPRGDERQAGWAAAGALAVEMEAAAILAVAARRGARAACLLAVTDLLTPGARQRIGADGYTVAGVRLGTAALPALG